MGKCGEVRMTYRHEDFVTGGVFADELEGVVACPFYFYFGGWAVWCECWGAVGGGGGMAGKGLEGGLELAEGSEGAREDGEAG